MAELSGWERVQRVMELTDRTRESMYSVRLEHAGFGLVEEVAELMQALRAGQVQKVYEEAADVMWYIAQMEDCLGPVCHRPDWQAPGADIPKGTLLDYVVTVSGAMKRWVRDGASHAAREAAFKRLAGGLPGLRLTVCLACYGAAISDLAQVLELKHADKIAAELQRREQLRAGRAPEVRS